MLKKLGDGLMALFGYPHAQENDACWGTTMDVGVWLRSLGLGRYDVAPSALCAPPSRSSARWSSSTPETPAKARRSFPRAIVGAVSTQRAEGGVADERGRQADGAIDARALAFAPGAAMFGPDAGRDALPEGRGDGQEALPDARRGEKAAPRPPVSGTATIAMGSALGKRLQSGGRSEPSSETFAALCSANLGGKGRGRGTKGSTPRQRVLDAHGFPLAAAGRRDTASIEGVGNGSQRRCAARLDLGGRPPSTSQIRFPESDGRSRN